jgi:SAM-dependent methyltransferase
VKTGSVDAVFCLEVFEHLPEAETKTSIDHMVRVLKEDGVLIIGVPIEIGFVAYVKGWFRTQRRKGGFDTHSDYIAQAAGKMITFEREKVEISDGQSYYPHHLGFDYRELIETLSKSFRLKSMRSSPMPWLPCEFNSELNLYLTKRAGSI